MEILIHVFSTSNQQGHRESSATGRNFREEQTASHVIGREKTSLCRFFRANRMCAHRQKIKCTLNQNKRKTCSCKILILYINVLCLCFFHLFAPKASFKKLSAVFCSLFGRSILKILHYSSITLLINVQEICFLNPNVKVFLSFSQLIRLHCTLSGGAELKEEKKSLKRT